MDLRIGAKDPEGAPWSVLSDLAITMVLVLVVFIVLIFVQTFRERMINSSLVQQQREVKEALYADPLRRAAIRIDSMEPGRQHLTFKSEALFAQCEANLRPSGEDLLRAVGSVLAEKQEYFNTLEIRGHTDKDRVLPKCGYKSNWELSSARATRVVTLFASMGLLNPRKLSAVGKAEFHPVVHSDSLDQNRRIEIVVAYDRERIVSEMGLSTGGGGAAARSDDVHYKRAGARITRSRLAFNCG